MIGGRESFPMVLCRGLRSAGVALLAVVSLSSCAKTEKQSEAELRPVRHLTVSSAGGRRLRSFPGTAKAGVESRLSFRVPGTVVSIPVRVGDTVTNGQLIAQLDSTDYELQVEEVRDSLTQAESQSRNAQASFERLRALYGNSNASLEEYDAARAAAESAVAQVRSVEKRLRLAIRQRDYTTLMAPAGGVIAAVNVERNENVAPGQSIVLLTSRRALEVEVDVPEGVISQIERGSAVTVTFDAIARERFEAEVTEVGVAPAQLSSTYLVTVELGRSHPGIRPGMAAEVQFSFELDEPGGALWVPPEAVGEDRDGRFVYAVERTGDERGAVHRRDVEVGRISSDGLEILSGLSEGDLVVTAGVSRLTDGEEVLLTSPAAE
jgi:RND family efflux transporter MFP subunit